MFVKASEKVLEVEKIIEKANALILSIEKENKAFITPEIEKELDSIITNAQNNVNHTIRTAENITDKDIKKIINYFEVMEIKMKKVLKLTREPFDEKDLAFMMFQLTQKLDAIISNQEKQKQKLNQLEIDTKISQKEAMKGIFEVPKVPLEDIEKIYNIFREFFIETLERVKQEGLYFIEEEKRRDEIENLKKISQQYHSVNIDNPIEYLIYAIKHTATILAYFVKDYKEWNGVYSKPKQFNENVDYELLTIIGERISYEDRIFNGYNSLFSPIVRKIFNEFDVKMHIPPTVEFFRKNDITRKENREESERREYIGTLRNNLTNEYKDSFRK